MGLVSWPSCLRGDCLLFELFLVHTVFLLRLNAVVTGRVTVHSGLTPFSTMTSVHDTDGSIAHQANRDVEDRDCSLVREHDYANDPEDYNTTGTGLSDRQLLHYGWLGRRPAREWTLPITWKAHSRTWTQA